jgi:hypothetical protein
MMDQSDHACAANLGAPHDAPERAGVVNRQVRGDVQSPRHLYIEDRAHGARNLEGWNDPQDRYGLPTPDSVK